MYEDSIFLTKNRLTFRQAGRYLKKPMRIIDYQHLIDDFSKQFLDDSDNESEISNPLIDKNDTPERILTLSDYRKKLKNLGSDFKFIDNFSNCYKNVVNELMVETQPEKSVDETVENINTQTCTTESSKKISNSKSYEHLKDEFHKINVPIPLIEKRKVMEIKKGTIELPTYWKLIEESKTSDIRQLELCEYEPEKSHWIDRPPVNWKIIEESRRKCLEWLLKYTY